MSLNFPRNPSILLQIASIYSKMHFAKWIQLGAKWIQIHAKWIQIHAKWIQLCAKWIHF